MSTVSKILIVDDHPLFRDALETAFIQVSTGPVEIHKAATLADAISLLDSHEIALVLLDLNLSDSSGFDGVARILGRGGSCPVFVVSATEQAEAYGKAKALGASGYIPKSLPMEELGAALATALDGGTWFPEITVPANDDEKLARIASLTPAQSRVLNGLSEGLLNKQIAYEMGISEATVKAHMTAILRKLGANNRTQALLIYKSTLAMGDDS